MPEVYVFNATVWNSPNAVFKDKSYDKEGQKSRPEWGVSYSKKNLDILEKHRAEEHQ